MLKILLGIILGLLSNSVYAQDTATAVAATAPPTNAQNPTSALATINQNSIFKTFPNGLSSILEVPAEIDEVDLGYTTLFVPKGYGKTTVLQYGVWNAIPFIVFDNSTLELRFGLIFEHRQNGFIPDEWINTSITGTNLPSIEFLIPKVKTFLNFSHGSSQWRATVLLTDAQINQLEQYAQSNQEVFSVNHRFIDGSSRPYLIGLRHKAYFQLMILLYKHIEKLPEIKKFQGSDAFPEGSFFDGVTVESVQTEELDIQEETIEENITVDDGGYYEDDPAPADGGDGGAGGYDDGAGYNEAGYDDGAGGYDDGGGDGYDAGY